MSHLQWILVERRSNTTFRVYDLVVIRVSRYFMRYLPNFF